MKTLSHPRSTPLVLLALTLTLWTATACRGEGPEPARSRDALPGRPPAVAGVDRPWRPAPGVLAVDEAVFLDPGWVLMDGAAGLLHLMDAKGRRVRTVGGPGNGPGELRGARHLAGDREGFWVIAVDGRLDRFDASGSFVARGNLLVEECVLADLERATVLQGRLYLAATCVLDRRRRYLLLGVADDGRARALRVRPSSAGDALTVHVPSVVSTGGRLAFGTGEEPCVSLLDASGVPTEADRCLPGPPIPVTPEMRRQLEATVGRQARGAGIRLHIPERFPWLDLLLAGADGEVLARRPVSERGWRLERLAPGGGSWPVPDGVSLHASHGRILLVHDGLEEVSLLELDAAEIPWEGGAGSLRARGPGR